MREATNIRGGGAAMRSLRFEFHPEQVRISTEEILADLRYPFRAERGKGGQKPVRRRRGRV